MVLFEVVMVVFVVYNNNDLCLDLNFDVGSGSYDARLSSTYSGSQHSLIATLMGIQNL